MSSKITKNLQNVGGYSIGTGASPAVANLNMNSNSITGLNQINGQKFPSAPGATGTYLSISSDGLTLYWTTVSGAGGGGGANGATGPTGPAGPIAGSTTQFIYNNAGVAGGAPGLTYAVATGTTTISAATMTGLLTVSAMTFGANSYTIGNVTLSGNNISNSQFSSNNIGGVILNNSGLSASSLTIQGGNISTGSTASNSIGGVVLSNGTISNASTSSNSIGGIVLSNTQIGIGVAPAFALDVNTTANFRATISVATLNVAGTTTTSNATISNTLNVSGQTNLSGTTINNILTLGTNLTLCGGSTTATLSTLTLVSNFQGYTGTFTNLLSASNISAGGLTLNGTGSVISNYFIYSNLSVGQTTTLSSVTILNTLSVGGSSTLNNVRITGTSMSGSNVTITFSSGTFSNNLRAGSLTSTNDLSVGGNLFVTGTNLCAAGVNATLSSLTLIGSLTMSGTIQYSSGSTAGDFTIGGTVNASAGVMSNTFSVYGITNLSGLVTVSGGLSVSGQTTFTGGLTAQSIFARGLTISSATSTTSNILTVSNGNVLFTNSLTIGGTSIMASNAALTLSSLVVGGNTIYGNLATLPALTTTTASVVSAVQYAQTSYIQCMAFNPSDGNLYGVRSGVDVSGSLFIITTNGVNISVASGYIGVFGLCFYPQDGAMYSVSFGVSRLMRYSNGSVTSIPFTGEVNLNGNIAITSGSGLMYVSSYTGGTIYSTTTAGVTTSLYSGFTSPRAIAYNSNTSNLYVAEAGGTIYSMSATGAIVPSVFSYIPPSVASLIYDGSQNLYSGNNQGQIYQIPLSTGNPVLIIDYTPLGSITGLYKSPNDNYLYISRPGASGEISRVSIDPYGLNVVANTYLQGSLTMTGSNLSAGGTTATFNSINVNSIGGSNISFTQFSTGYLNVVQRSNVTSSLTGSWSIAYNPSDGFVYIPSWQAATMQQVNPTTSRISIPYSVGLTYAVCFNPFDSAIYSIHYNGNVIVKYSIQALRSFSTTPGGILSGVYGITAGSNNLLYVASSLNGTIATVTTAGVTTSLYTGFSSPRAVAYNSNTTRLFVADYTGTGIIYTLSTTGATITPSELVRGLAFPQSLVYDGSQNLYVGTNGGSIFQVSVTTGISSLVLSGYSQIPGIAISPSNTGLFFMGTYGGVSGLYTDTLNSNSMNVLGNTSMTGTLTLTSNFNASSSLATLSGLIVTYNLSATRGLFATLSTGTFSTTGLATISGNLFVTGTTISAVNATATFSSVTITNTLSGSSARFSSSLTIGGNLTASGGLTTLSGTQINGILSINGTISASIISGLRTINSVSAYINSVNDYIIINNLSGTGPTGTSKGLVGLGYSAIGAPSALQYTNAIGWLAGNGGTGNYTNVIGFQAGVSSTGANLNAFGSNAGSNNWGTSNIFIGDNAGANASGSSNVAVGFGALCNSRTPLNIGIGYNAGSNSSGASSIYIGQGAGSNNTMSNSIFIGSNSGYAPTLTNPSIIIYSTSAGRPFLQGDLSACIVGLAKVPTAGITLDVSGTVQASNVSLARLNGLVWPNTTPGGSNFVPTYSNGAVAWAAQSGGGGSASDWATFRATQAVDISGYDLSGIRTINQVPVVFRNGTSQIGIGSNALSNNTATGVIAIGISAGQGTGTNGSIYLGSNPGYTNPTGTNKFVVYSTLSSIPFLQGDMIGTQVGLGIGKVSGTGVTLDVSGGLQTTYTSSNALGPINTTLTGNVGIGLGSGIQATQALQVNGTIQGCNVSLASTGFTNTIGGVSFPGSGVMTATTTNVSSLNTLTLINGLSSYITSDVLVLGTPAVSLSTANVPASIGIGLGALTSASGSRVIAIGLSAGFKNLGDLVVAIGSNALANTNANTDGTVGIGFNCGNRSTGANAVLVGAGITDTSGNNLVIVGSGAGLGYAGRNSVILGAIAGSRVAGITACGESCIHIGTFAGAASGGDYTITMGWYAGYTGFGANNVLIGFQSGYNITGARNVALGDSAFYNLSGTFNIGLGYNAGSNASAASSCIFLGTAAGSGSSANRSIYIGSNAGQGNKYSNTIMIGNNPGTTALVTASDTFLVYSTKTALPFLQGDMSANLLGIARSPSYPLDVSGTIRAGNIISTINVGVVTASPVTLTTGNYSTYFTVTAPTASVNVILPGSAPIRGSYWVVKNNSSVNYTLTYTGGFINATGVTTGYLQAGVGVTLVYSGTGSVYYTF